MRHMLMDPAFPDLVAQAAVEETTELEFTLACCANDDWPDPTDAFADPLLTALAKMDVAATRLW